ncbi:MAG: ribose 5-phosphate isomerase B [Lentisphaerae bacterium]|nr:ribose 5-phosphate isomerase B [Lentisphaerota bacterium]
MKVAIGADHGGFPLKETVREMLEARGITVEDVGCYDTNSVDYPDYAREVAQRVSRGEAEQGVLVCTTGTGMAMTANRFPGVRAAQCFTPAMAELARAHNNANVLALGGGMLSPETAGAIVEAWLDTAFSAEARHARRVGKMEQYGRSGVCADGAADAAVRAILDAESERQRTTLDLIASENYVSPAVRQAVGSVLSNKYAEGYPGKRWYQGCANMDRAERLAVERAGAVFGAEHANVQPHSGSTANMAVYFAALAPGDTILAMSLAHGGHLTHGHAANFSGRLYNVVGYGVDRDTEQLDFGEIARLAETVRPKLIVAGASAYPRTLDFSAFREIADKTGALLMVDMAHIAGLIAAGVHPSPVPHAEFVTATTHKTLRGPRGGVVLCRSAFADEVDRQIFPGLQGGPEMHTILGKAVCFQEALQPAFKAYGQSIVRNARSLAERLAADGFRLVSGGTDNHLMLVDLTSAGLTGKAAATALERAGIVVNKNCIPFDTRSPFVTSGIRLGTPAVTTRGMGEDAMHTLGGLIGDVLRAPDDEAVTDRTRRAVAELAGQFPVP